MWNIKLNIKLFYKKLLILSSCVMIKNKYHEPKYYVEREKLNIYNIDSLHVP